MTTAAPPAAKKVHTRTSAVESAVHRLPRTSIVIVNTDEIHHLQRCLPSIYTQNYPDYEVLVIDNASTDGSIAFIQQNFPQVRIIENQKNLGYAGANNVGFDNAAGDTVAVLNPDTRVEPDWLLELVLALEEDPTAGLATPKILLMDDPSLINTCGNEITYSGLTVCRGLDQPADQFKEKEIVSAVSGAAFVIKRAVLDEIGGFDDRFFIYYEETDLCLRAMLAGYKCLYVPTSVVYHQYSFRYSSAKAFFQERNRYFAMLKALRWRTLMVLMPALLLAEILAWGYSAAHGFDHLLSKFKAYIWLAKNWQLVMAARRKVQATRVVDDRILIERFGHHLTLTQTTSPMLARSLEAICQPILLLTGRFSRWIVRW